MKKILLICMSLIVFLAACTSENEDEKKYGNLTIDYSVFKDEKMNYDLSRISDYNYDVISRYENDESDKIQKTLEELFKLNTIYQDILFTYSILLKENTEFIEEEDKKMFFNNLDKETKSQWVSVLKIELYNIDKSYLMEEDVYLIENANILIDLLDKVLDDSLNGEYNEKVMREISKNLEKNMAQLIVMYLTSTGKNAEKIEVIIEGIKNNEKTDFNDTFYYQLINM